MNSSLSEDLNRIIQNRDKAYEEAYNRINKANEQKIKELEEKRQYHLNMTEYNLMKKAEVEQEIERRLSS